VHPLLRSGWRNPGITIGGLCRVLGVTKQAVHQPLTAVIDKALVARAVEPTNRRVRTLRLTTRGVQLEERLAAVQRIRFERAFRAAGTTAETSWREVMRLLAARD
jgi:DNA-binding MarR family transcriptional regulator